MTRTIGFKRAIGAGLAVALVCGTVVFGRVTAQQPITQQAQTQTKTDKPIIPLRVQVTLSRYEGEKRTSNLPFTLWVNANGETTTLNVGARVPTPTTTVTPVQAVESYSYNPVGTNLSSSATSLDDGRFNLALSISDSSLVPTKGAGGGNLPTFQSFSSQNRLLLRDGQTAQFIAATDKVTGEVTRVEVTIAVIK